MSNELQKKMILNDNLWSVATKLSIPAIIAMVLYGLNSVFDAIFVGAFVGADALASVSISYPLSQLTLGIGSLIGVGAGSLLSILLGKNDIKSQEKILGNTNYLTIITSIIYMIFAFVFAEKLVAVMGGTGEILRLGTQYFKITAIGSFFWIHGLALNLIVRAEGKMKSAAVMMGVGLIANIIANYILIVFFELGVAGAAWGTNIGMLVYTIQGLYYFQKGKASFEAKPFSVRKDNNISKSIFSMGMPSLIMQVMNLVMAFVVFNALSKYGTTFDIAFYGATYRIFTFMLTPLFGLMRALQPVVGINYGAEENERVISSMKVFTSLGTILILPFWIIIMVFPNLILSLMLPNVAYTSELILNFRVFMSLLPILPVIFMSMTFFPAINNGKIASIMGVLRQLVLYVPVMVILPKILGVNWVYYGSALIDTIVTIGIVLAVASQFKKLRSNKNKTNTVSMSRK